MLQTYKSNTPHLQTQKLKCSPYQILPCGPKVVVNRGACLVLPDNKITNLPSYGSRAEYLMGGCYARNITEIAVYLNDNKVVTFN